MPLILIVGIIIFIGFICAEIAKAFGLPKVTGYILGGVLLNPDLIKIIPSDFVEHTDLITTISLSFITFSVGGTLLWQNIKKLGKTIISITFFEAEIAFLAVFIGFVFCLPYFTNIAGATMLKVFIPLSLLLAALASPTDPSATLAVVHEYKAKGKVSSTIMGVAAMDDVFGIINYSFAVIIISGVLTNKSISLFGSIYQPLLMICLSILLGILFGIIFNLITNFFRKETQGSLIVVIFAMLFVCFGTSRWLGLDELLSTMIMGIIVVNFNSSKTTIFNMLERYTEEFIFALFFTLSGMHLNFSTLSSSLILILIFVVLRSLGKILGTNIGSRVSKADNNIRKFTAGGLIPQGGIVVGLALLISQNQLFSEISQIVMNVIIGSTVIHEFIGPITAKLALKKAKEI